MKKIIRKSVAAFHRKKLDRTANLKLKKIEKNIEKIKLSNELKQQYLNLWNTLGEKPSLLFLNCVSSISGIKSSRYVPENIHYNLIEPALNSRPFALPFNDKNFFEKLLPDHCALFPQAILRRINGVLYDHDYYPVKDRIALNILSRVQAGENLVLKPGTETGGGANVKMVEKSGDGFVINELDHIDLSGFLRTLNRDYSSDFILQKKIVQHDYFSKFNSSSLNTVRLYTYRSVKDESIKALHAYIRFGINGSFVDSSSQGGRTCGIFMDGLLNSFAIGKYGEKYNDIEWVNKNMNLPVPKFIQMKQLAAEIAPMFKYHRLLGFDFALDEKNNIRLLEVNNLYIGIINQQMNTGPLFGDFTEEVIDYCLTHRKSYNYHFYL